MYISLSIYFYNKIILAFAVALGLKPYTSQVGGQAVLGRQDASPTPWLTERHGYDPTSIV